MDPTAIGDRPLGGIIGAVVPAAVAGGSAWLDWPVTVIAAFGIPIGAFVGYTMAPRVIAADDPLRPAFLSAVVAVLVAIVGCMVWAVIATGTPPINYLPFLPFLTFLAFVVGMPVAVPVALVGAGLLRWTAGRRPTDEALSEERAASALRGNPRP